MQILTSSVLSTGLIPMFAGAGVIEIEDTHVGEGGFGIVYRAQSFDGHRPAIPQVIKLLTKSARQGLNTIQGLQRFLKAEQQTLLAKGDSLLSRFPALYGVPQLSFEGVLNGEPVLGYSANDLTHAGYEDFVKVLEDNAKITQYQLTPFWVRFRIAAQFAAAFDFLTTRGHFLHADIKAGAVFVDYKNGRCALIDFDSGVLIQNHNDRATTFGAPQPWLAPEIFRQLYAPELPGPLVEVNWLSDMWSVAWGIHYLLFGFEPLFFLSEVTETSMKEYRRSYQWPQVDPVFPYFSQGSLPYYQACCQMVSAVLSPEMLKQFAFTIHKGYDDPSQRTTYSQWHTLLKTATHPAIRSFEADRVLVDDDRPVRLSWDVCGAARLEIKGIGDVFQQEFVDVPVRQDTVFELILTPDFNAPISRTLLIEVSKEPPKIDFFTASSSFLASAVPVKLSWSITGGRQVQIDQGIGDVTGRSEVSVLPRSDTTYTLTATSFSGISSIAKVEVKVSPIPPSIHFFHGDRKHLTDGRPVELSWSVSDDAHEVSINAIGSVARRGTVSIDQKTDMTYVLTASSYFGYATAAHLHVSVSKEPPAIEQLKISPVLPGENMEVELEWRVSNATQVFIDPMLGAVLAEGRATFPLGEEESCVLRASSYYGVTATKELRFTFLRPTKLTTSLTELTAQLTNLTTNLTDLYRCTALIPTMESLPRNHQSD